MAGDAGRAVLYADPGVDRGRPQLALALSHPLQRLQGVGLRPLQDGGEILLLGGQHLLGDGAGARGDRRHGLDGALEAHLDVEGGERRLVQVRVHDVLLHFTLGTEKYSKQCGIFFLSVW